MGSRNVAAVFENWGTLDNLPFRVLAYMALKSIDGDVSPEWMNYREVLISEALGREDNKASWDAVKRALRRLREAGAITDVGHPHPYRPACYALNLQGVKVEV